MSDAQRLVDHEYDGIQEYDNPLPGWWSLVFAITIVFAGVYAFWFHLGGPGESEHAEFAADWKAHERTVAAAKARQRFEVTPDVLEELAHDPDVMARGRALFGTHCVGCHLASGGGQTGPNLTDEFQIHGSTRMDIFTTVRDGVIAKGMLAWGNVLRPEEVATVAAYASSLRATNAPDGKHPEGRKVGRLP